MDITFLVGNGFDLSLGYATSYESFYKYYLDQPNDPKYDEAISRLKLDIEEDRVKGKKNWSDFEIGLGQFTKHFRQDETTMFVDAYRDAHQHMLKYLSQRPKYDIINSISENELDKIRRNLCYFYQECKERDRNFFYGMNQSDQASGSPAKFHFISFNYTDFLDKCIEKIAQKPLDSMGIYPGKRNHILDKNVIHAHGTLSSYPIMGVSEEEQIFNQTFRKNNRLRICLLKQKGIDKTGILRSSDAIKIIKNSRIICLWGVSLGESDKHWWKIINEWLKRNTNNFVFIFEYDPNPPSGLFVLDDVQKELAVANRMLCHSGYSDDESLTSRIHVIFNTDKVLSFPKINDPNK